MWCLPKNKLPHLNSYSSPAHKTWHIAFKWRGTFKQLTRIIFAFCSSLTLGAPSLSSIDTLFQRNLRLSRKKGASWAIGSCTTIIADICLVNLLVNNLISTGDDWVRPTSHSIFLCPSSVPARKKCYLSHNMFSSQSFQGISSFFFFFALRFFFFGKEEKIKQSCSSAPTDSLLSIVIMHLCSCCGRDKGMHKKSSFWDSISGFRGSAWKGKKGTKSERSLWETGAKEIIHLSFIRGQGIELDKKVWRRRPERENVFFPKKKRSLRALMWSAGTECGPRHRNISINALISPKFVPVYYSCACCSLFTSF